MAIHSTDALWNHMIDPIALIAVFVVLLAMRLSICIVIAAQHHDARRLSGCFRQFRPPQKSSTVLPFSRAVLRFIQVMHE